MGANQNSYKELGLYPKINPKSISSNSADRLAIDKLSAFGTGLGTTSEARNSASKTTSEIGDKNWTEEQFMSS
jgi:hypothetical protein